MCCNRKVLRPSCTEGITNEEVLHNIHKEARLLPGLMSRQLSYLGYILSNSTLGREFLLENALGKQKTGRPRISFIDNVKEESGFSLIQANRAGQDCTKWRAITKGAPGGSNMSYPLLMVVVMQVMMLSESSVL